MTVYDGGFVADKRRGEGGGDVAGAGAAFAGDDRDIADKPFLFAFGVTVVSVYACFTLVA